MKIIFAGTPEFALPTLEELFKSGHEISLVITQRDRPKGRGKKLQYTPVKEKALQLGLEVYQPDNINSDESIEKLKMINPDFLIVVAFGQILKKKVLDIPKIDALNVHASLLPKYRGAAPINWAILNGEEETGVTIMKIDEGLDTGDIISSVSTPIDDADDAITVHDRLSRLGGELIVSTLVDIVNNRAKYTPQKNEISTYAPMLYKDNGRIDWNKPSKDIFNQVRGLKPWPSAFTYYEDKQIKIHKIKLTDENSNGEPGKIVDVSNSSVFINSADKIIVVEELQFPNKRPMKVSEYLAGNSIVKGTILK